MSWPSAMPGTGRSCTCAWAWNRFTLIDTVFACAMLTIVMTTVSQVAYRVTLFGRRATEDTLMQHRVYLIEREWRRFVDEIDPADWRAAETVFTSADGRWVASVDEGEIVFFRPGRPWTMPVAPNSRAAFVLEQPAGGPCVAVLNLSWQFAPGPVQTVRLVAARAKTWSLP